MSTETSPTAGPLDGLRIIEGGSFVAVPSGAMTLAMLGAEVIRFDPIGGGGDFNRAPINKDGISLYWASMQKGKRSLAVDIRSPEGQELLSDLITMPGDGNGIYITNAPAHQWNSEEALRAKREDIITVRLSGLPDGGAAVDYTVNYELGYPTITGPLGSGPVSNAVPAWDLLAGLNATTSLLAAERRRSRTGLGDQVKMSLRDVAFAVGDALGYFQEIQLNGAEREPSGNFVFGTFGVPFPTKDGGHVMLVALTKAQWRDLTRITETDEIVGMLGSHLGVDFDDEHARWAHRDLLFGVLAPWFADRTTKDAFAPLKDSRVLASTLHTFTEAFHSDAVQGNPMFTPVTHPKLGSFVASGVPAFFTQANARPTPVAPVLGQDTEWVLADVMGMNQTEIGGLMQRKVVAQA